MTGSFNRCFWMRHLTIRWILIALFYPLGRASDRSASLGPRLEGLLGKGVIVSKDRPKMSEEKELGRISEVFLGREDHGILSFMITFDFGGSGQGFGGYALDTYNKTTEKREGTAFGCEVISRILEAVGVSEWKQLKGKEMWVYHSHTKIRRIEAPQYRKDAGRPLDIEELAKQYYPGES